MATCRRAGIALLGALAFAPRGEALAQVRVTAQWLYPIETLYLADLSSYTVGRQPVFLSINLLNGSVRTEQVVLQLSLRRERPTASQIFEGRTNPFLLEPGSERITNRDLSCERCRYAIEHGEVSNEFEDLLAQTGRFPAGSYAITVRVLTAGLAEIDRTEVRIELVNPSRIELLSPGQRFGESPEVVNIATPRFVWSADAGVVSGGGEYRIRVVPVDGPASADDVMQGFASWEARTTATTAIYPGSVSAIPLQPGATYAWQVVREIRSSSGTELLSSPIYWFRMATSQSGEGGRRTQGAAGDVGGEGQLRELARLLGLGDQLSGFRPGAQLLVNGQPYPADRLEELIRAILAGELTIHTVTLR